MSDSPPPPPHVKICGVTRLQDAEVAVAIGAWGVGMVLVADSPRRCSLEVAEQIGASLRRRAEVAGVFVNAHMDDVVRFSDQVGLTIVQLHGDEGPAYCQEVARRTGAKVCKAVQISRPGDVRALRRFHVDFHLTDARSSAPAAQSLRGGTGETFDWALLSDRHSQVPLILSGGLDESNIVDAIEACRPFAVDTASGTEAAPGIKDEARMRAFMEAVATVAVGTPA